eukprot:g9676.t1
MAPGPGEVGSRRRGPKGTSCCCWLWLCFVAFVALAAVGITLNEELDIADMAQSTCYEIDAVIVAVLGVLALCCCYCCLKPSGYHPADGTNAERQPILGTAPPAERTGGGPKPQSAV